MSLLGNRSRNNAERRRVGRLHVNWHSVFFSNVHSIKRLTNRLRSKRWKINERFLSYNWYSVAMDFGHCRAFNYYLSQKYWSCQYACPARRVFLLRNVQYFLITFFLILCSYIYRQIGILYDKIIPLKGRLRLLFCIKIKLYFFICWYIYREISFNAFIGFLYSWRMSVSFFEYTWLCYCHSGAQFQYCR